MNEREVREFGCDTDFIKLKNGMSRINVKIKADVESEINGGGKFIVKIKINIKQEEFIKCQF